MRVRSFLDTFVFVRKCGGCGELLGADNVEGVFCEECRLRWNFATVQSCSECLQSATECTCMPKQLSRAGALCLRKLFFYDNEDSYSPEMRMLFLQKNRKINRINRFLSARLCNAAEQELGLLGAQSRAVVTYVPRSRRARAEFGFDQSRRLAREMARSLNCECVDAFDTRLFVKKQKELDARQRVANARKNIRLKREAAAVAGRYVLLVDDMVTTGASMAVCTKELMKRGALGVLCFSVASRQTRK